MNSRSTLVVFLWVAVLWNGDLSAQNGLAGNPLGSIHGTIRAVSQGRDHAVPLRSAKLELVVRRNHEDVVIQSSSTDNSGNFRLRSGAILEQPFLHVEADGLAPARFPLKKVVNGEGLLLPDLYLDSGVPVSTSIDASLVAEAPVWLFVFPLTDSQRTIDLDGKPLLQARFDTQGRIILPHVAPGLYGFVATDHFSRITPALQVWKVGHDPVTLPPFAVHLGSTLEIEFSAKTTDTIEGELLTGFGRWHPDGGEEYRLRKRLRTIGSKEGKASFKIEHLPPSLCDISLQNKGKTFSGRLQPGVERQSLVMSEGAMVGGHITVPTTKVNWDEAIVLIGGRLARVSKNGEFECDGLPVGSHSVFVFVPGFPAITNRRVVLKAGEERRDFHVTLAAGSQISGETRNPDLKRVPYVWVGCDVKNPDPRFLGQLFQGISANDGSYEIDGLAAGDYQVYLRPPSDAYCLVREIELEEGVSASAHLRFAKGGFGGGTLLSFDKQAVPFAVVQLIRHPVPLSYVVGAKSHPRLAEPFVRQTVTDRKGQYSFKGVRPGLHTLVFHVLGQGPELAEDIRLTAGVNRIGFDWQLQPFQAVTLNLPVDRPYRLRSIEHDLIDRWLIRPAGTAAIAVSELINGSYRVDPMPVHLAHVNFVKEPVNYVEWRPGALSSRFSVPHSDIIPIRQAPDLSLESQRIRMKIGGEFPADTERIELTAFPLAGAIPLEPIRLPIPENLSEFDVTLPRGIWFIQALSAHRGAGATGPFSLGRGFEPKILKPIDLNIEARAIAIGFVDLVRSESEQGQGVLVSALEDRDQLIRPWKISLPTVPLSESGDLRFEGVPAGASRLRVFGPHAHIDVPVECDSFELKDLRRIVPGLPSALNLDFSATAFLDSSLLSLDGEIPLARHASLLPGPFIFGFQLPWDEIEDSGVWSLRQSFDLESGDVLLGTSDLSARGRVSMRGTLRLDNINLAYHAVELVPVLGDAYDVSRPILRGRTGRLGEFRFTKIVAGDYAFVLSYSDDEGRRYQLALPLNLPDRSTTVTENVRLKTRALSVVTFDTDNGDAGEGALVRILRTDLRGLGSSTVFRGKIEEITRGIADQTGEVTFRSLPLGTYDVEVSRRGRVTEVLQGIDLGIGSGALTLRAPAVQGLPATVEVLDEEETPLVGAECFLFDPSGKRVLADVLLQTDALGRIYLRDLVAQKYRMFIKAPGFPSQQLADIQVDPQMTRVQTRQAYPGANLEIRCVDDEGNQIQGVKVFVEAETGFWEHFGPKSTILDERPSDVNQFGTLELRNVPQGTCKLRATHDGFHTFIGTTKVRSTVRNEFELILKRKP